MNLFTRNSPYYHLLKYLLFLLKHRVYGMFRILLFNFVNYVFLLLCYIFLLLCIFIIMCSVARLSTPIVMYVPFCVLCLTVLFCVLFVCKGVLYYCHRMPTQLQSNISQFIIHIKMHKMHYIKRTRYEQNHDPPVVQPAD
jgi:hypothetical protein